MITKAKELKFTTSDGRKCDTAEMAKKIELEILCRTTEDHSGVPQTIFDALVTHPREAIAILRFGLPRKPRTPKPPMGRKPRRKIKQDMPDPFDNAPRVRTANEIAKGQ